MRLLLLIAAVALMAAVQAAGQEVQQDLSLMEIGSSSTINSAAARPLQDVARLLIQANRNIEQLKSSREDYQVLSNHVKVHHHTNIVLGRKKAKKAKKASKAKVSAELLNRVSQPVIHDPHRFGTKYPVPMGHKWVNAAIVGEDGKPYVPRKQYGVETDPDEGVKQSPFAKYVQPPAVGSSADVVNSDPNTKLTPLELKRINSLQKKLKGVLDRLGANIVWDHTPVKNRRMIAEYEGLKTQARALMEEYELRTGVKTIAWQLATADVKGLFLPNGRVKDIHFASNPELASRALQRPGDRKGPPPPTKAMLKQAAKDEAIAKGTVNGGVHKEQRVDLSFGPAGPNGIVRPEIKLRVVKSKVPRPDLPPNTSTRPYARGKLYRSGRRGAASRAAQIDVIAPRGAELKRNKATARVNHEAIAAAKEAAAEEAAELKMNL